jgi:peptidoglycan/xylan/chitin deacetylase (PgdA/CDA1 family)
MLTRRQFLKGIGTVALWQLVSHRKLAHADGFTFPVYLTFDDGVDTELALGETGPTLDVLDILDEHGINATFFVHGRNTSMAEGVVLARMLETGHRVANHGYMQGGMLLEYQPTPSYMTKQFLDTENRLREALADYPEALAIYTAPGYPHMFRRPGGGYDSSEGNRFLASAESRELFKVDSYLNPYWEQLDWLDGVYDYSGWHVNPLPLFRHIESAQEVIDAAFFAPLGVDEFLRPVPDQPYLTSQEVLDGLIILLHDPDPRVIAALPALIDMLKERGATFHVLPRPIDQPNAYTVGIGRSPTPVIDPYVHPFI